MRRNSIFELEEPLVGCLYTNANVILKYRTEERGVETQVRFHETRVEKNRRIYTHREKLIRMRSFRTTLSETRLPRGIWIESVQRVGRVIGTLSGHSARVHPAIVARVHSSARARLDTVSVT